MFQKGPGGGFGADAKAAALAINPKLKCFRASHLMGRPYYVVLEGGGIGVGKRVGQGGSNPIEAWRSARSALASCAPSDHLNIERSGE
jgi:hypothetical protein